jgi:hypothetical protein
MTMTSSPSSRNAAKAANIPSFAPAVTTISYVTPRENCHTVSGFNVLPKKGE